MRDDHRHASGADLRPENNFGEATPPSTPARQCHRFSLMQAGKALFKHKGLILLLLKNYEEKVDKGGKTATILSAAGTTQVDGLPFCDALSTSLLFLPPFTPL